LLKIEQLDEYVSEIIADRFITNMESIDKEYKKNKENINKEFNDILHDLYFKCIKLQGEGRKGKIAVLYISFLYTSCLTGKIEFQINLYDNKIYLDREEVVSNWSPSFIYKYYYSDFEYIEKSAKKNVLNFGYKHMQMIKQRLALDYHNITMKLLSELIKDIVKDEAFLKVQKENEFFAFFGGYMDNAIPILKFIDAPQEDKK
jgi:hypothetical protein